MSGLAVQLRCGPLVDAERVRDAWNALVWLTHWPVFALLIRPPCDCPACWRRMS